MLLILDRVRTPTHRALGQGVGYAEPVNTMALRTNAVEREHRSGLARPLSFEVRSVDSGDHVGFMVDQPHELDVSHNSDGSWTGHSNRSRIKAIHHAIPVALFE